MPEKQRPRGERSEAPTGRWAPIVVTPSAVVRLVKDTARLIRKRRPRS